MSLMMFESFDYISPGMYLSSQLVGSPNFGLTYGGSVGREVYVQCSNGRRGGRALDMGGPITHGYITVTKKYDHRYWGVKHTVGFAFYPYAFPNSNTLLMFFTEDNPAHFPFCSGLSWDATNLYIRGQQTAPNVYATIDTIGNPFTLNTWQYLEIQTLFEPGASGSVEVKLNGSRISYTTGVATAGGYWFGDMANQVAFYSGDYRVDDLYVITDTDGVAPVSFIGDTAMGALWPAADGAHQDFLLNGGSDAWKLVRKHTGQDFRWRPTTVPYEYIYSSTNGDKASYLFTGLDPLWVGPAAAVSLAIFGSSWGDGSQRDLADYFADGDSYYTPYRAYYGDYSGPSLWHPGDYQAGEDVCSRVYPHHPSSGATWTVTELNSLDAGVYGWLDAPGTGQIGVNALFLQVMSANCMPIPCAAPPMQGPRAWISE